eukprot:2796952-Pyramimonas_sp.AAC.1
MRAELKYNPDLPEIRKRFRFRFRPIVTPTEIVSAAAPSEAALSDEKIGARVEFSSAPVGCPFARSTAARLAPESIESIVDGSRV